MAIETTDARDLRGSDCRYVAVRTGTFLGEHVTKGITRVSGSHPLAQTLAFAELDSERGEAAVRDAGGTTPRRRYSWQVLT